MKGFDFFFEDGDFYKDSDLSVINVGLSHNEPGFTFGHDWRTYYILHYVVSGSGIYTVNNSTYTLNKQNCFLVPPNTPVIYKADDKDPWTCYWVGFKGNKAKKYIERVLGKTNLHIILIMTFLILLLISNLCSKKLVMNITLL